MASAVKFVPENGSGAVKFVPEHGGSTGTNRIVIAVAVVVLFISFVLFIVGVVLLSKKSCDKTSKTSALTSKHWNPKCRYSEEAMRVGLPSFLDKVKAHYYEYNPHNIAWDPDLKKDQLRVAKLYRYRPYNPDPKYLKLKTDISLSLLKEIMNKEIDEDKLKPRESKALAQVKHYLQHTFGVPYDENYYAGDWMMGPNFFCWQPICNLPYNINSFADKLLPKTYDEVRRIYDTLRAHKKTFQQYRKNLELGVLTGMVRTVEDCVSGLHAFKEKFPQIALSGNSSGVLKEWYTAKFRSPEFLSSLNKDVKKRWKYFTRRTINQSLNSALVEGIGKPVLDLIQYLENEHMTHCLHSNVSSGLAKLPVDYVYTNLVPNKTRLTTKKLPTGEALVGNDSYKKILSYFTTYNITPEEIYEKGQEQFDKFFPKCIEIAKNVTGQSDIIDAILAFVPLLNAEDQWHNTEIFPDNESNPQAHKICSSPERAKKYCPKRWEALQKWSTYIRGVMGRILPKLTPFFYYSGKKITAANCPIEMEPHFNPSQGTMYFKPSDAECTRPSYFGLPFFLGDYGPKYQEWSVTGHEARPGHHTQMQGLREHFRDKCGGAPQWLDKETSYIAFQEGWALYGENPILSDDVNLYKDNIPQLYGMYKWQIWRAVRLIVDTGLHYRGMKRAEALGELTEKTWDQSDLAEKEVTRYMSIPGQATAYMLGRLEIISMRKKAEKELGEDFNIRDFHYQLLSQGSAPITFVRSHIDRYIRCMKKELTGEVCDLILLTSPKDEDAKTQKESNIWEENIGDFEKQAPRPALKIYP